MRKRWRTYNAQGISAAHGEKHEMVVPTGVSNYMVYCAYPQSDPSWVFEGIIITALVWMQTASKESLWRVRTTRTPYSKVGDADSAKDE